MTLSIVARDPETGEFGAATASASLAVGAIVPHAMADVGAVATQGYSSNPTYGPDGLALLADGRSAEVVVKTLTRVDEGRERRQVVVVDALGRTAARTGGDNLPAMGHICRPDFAVAGNMLAGEAVLEAMAAAFSKAEDETLAERLLRALRAGDAAGGDRRGRQSAAIRVFGRERYALVDLRADDAPDPVADLFRLHALSREPAVTAFRDRLPTRDAPHRS